MKYEVRITLDIELAIGEVNLNEIVYRLEAVKDPMMCQVLATVLKEYDNEIATRLTEPRNSKERKGLGQHIVSGSSEERVCRCRRSRKRGYRQGLRHIRTVFGEVKIPVRVVECAGCGARHTPLMSALGVEKYARRESNFEHEVIEAVIDTNYRRLIDNRSVNISLGGVHNVVVGSDIDKAMKRGVCTSGLAGLMADGTGLKQSGGRKGELRAVVGVKNTGGLVPLGFYVNQNWDEIQTAVRQRIKADSEGKLPFLFDGEPGLDGFLAQIASGQRCVWHGPRGLYSSLWQDGLGKKGSKPYTSGLRGLLGVELPEGDFDLLREEDKEAVKASYEQGKQGIQDMIALFAQKGYKHAVTYLTRLAEDVYTHVEMWLATGVIAPKTTSLLERLFREIGRRMKRIAFGWSDKGATNLSKMIVIRQYDRATWEAYWKEKLGIKGAFSVNVATVEISPCHNL